MSVSDEVLSSAVDPAAVQVADTTVSPPPPQKPRRRLRTGVIFVLSGIVTGALALAAVSIGLLSSNPPTTGPAIAAETAPAAVATKPPSITVAKATRGKITQTATVTGSLIAQEEVLVASQVDGLALTEILVEEGQTVTAGQVLARLSRETTEVSLAQSTAQLERAQAAIDQSKSSIDEASATLAQAESAFERARSLMKTGSTTTDNIEQREAAAKSARARLAQSQQALKLSEADLALTKAQRTELEVRLARTEIKAPSAGIITRRTARVGVVVSGAGDPLFRIMKDGAIDLDALVPETTLAGLSAGLPARIFTAARPEAFPGKVRLIAAEVNTSTRLGSVKIAIDPAPGLHVGAFGRAEIDVATHEGVLAPQSAILYSAGGALVQVVKDGVVETRTVKIGLRTLSKAEILDGLAEGEQIVVTAGTFVRDGDKVTPVEAPVAVSSVN